MHRTDEPRDDWLKKALDHAPDTPVPPALRETILRASRSPGPAPATVPWWSRLSAWIVRPQVAAGFASVAMVTVAGLLWHDEPLPPMPASTPPAARAPAAEAPVVPAAPAPAPVAEPAPAKPAPARPPAPKAREVAPPVMKPAPVADTAARSEPPMLETTAVPLPAPPPAPAPAVAAAPPPPAAEAPAERRAAAAESARADSQRKSMAPSGALRRQAEASAGAAFAPTPARLADVRAALAATPDRWTWQRQSGTAQPAGTPVSDWLALLDASAGSGWTAASGPRTGAAELQLLLDGQPAHRWVVTDQAVFWFSPGGTWQAPVGAPAARRLLEALETLP